jgi:cytochrome o ubiquinol oxidase operon protein cyoD
MSKSSEAIIATHEETKLKLGSYIAGFVLSVLLTISAYLMVVNNGASRDVLVGVVSCLAITQFIVQAYFFLHLGKESRPKWKLYVFIFMIGVVLIIVFGSLWIMNNLNYRMSIPQQVQYLNNQDGL